MRKFVLAAAALAALAATPAKAGPAIEPLRVCEAKYGQQADAALFAECVKNSLNLRKEFEQFKKKGDAYVKAIPDEKLILLLVIAQRRAGGGEMAMALAAEGIARGMLSPI